MKKLILIIFCSTHFILLAQNQPRKGNNFRQKQSVYSKSGFNEPWSKSSQRPTVNFGFKAGINVNNMNFNKGYPTPEIPIKSSWNPGFVLGLLMEVPLNESFYIQPEYLYLQLGSEQKESGITYSMSYLSLPLLLKYMISDKLAFLGGPQFDLLIKAKQDGSTEDSNITHDTEERSISATAGVEFNIIKNFSLSAGYMHGINHIGIGQRSAVKEFKYESVNLAGSIKF